MFTTGSYDPNDITVNRSFLYTTEVSSGHELDYLIRFQNIGNDTAFNVKIINPIDTNLFELNSFRFINSSHPVHLEWLSWQKNFDFTFDRYFIARQ